MAKKKRAKKKGAVRRPRGKSGSIAGIGSTAQESQSDDLADVLRQEGIAEPRIPQLIAIIRTMSDSQIVEGTPPTEPTPALLDSPQEMNVAAAAHTVVNEAERSREQTEEALRVGRRSAVDARRDSIWAMELMMLRGPPRLTFIGRSIHVNTQRQGTVADYVSIYQTIARENRALLPETIQRAITTIDRGAEGQTKAERRRNSKNAASALRKNLDGRVGLLIRTLELAIADSSVSPETYRLKPRGRRVFDGWPDWQAAPR